MRTKPNALLAAGQALASAEAHLRDSKQSAPSGTGTGTGTGTAAAAAVRITIDGKDVDEAAARAALSAMEADRSALHEAEPSRLENTLERFEPRFERVETVLGRNRLGQRALDVVKQNPELVKRRFDVDVTIDSHHFKVTVDVVDPRASVWMHRAALGVDAVSVIPFIPFLGLAVRGSASLVAFTMALVAKTANRDAVADALMGSARKQLTLGGFEAAPIPGLSTGSAIAAAIANGQNLVALRQAPTVAAVVSLTVVP